MLAAADDFIIAEIFAPIVLALLRPPRPPPPERCRKVCVQMTECECFFCSLASLQFSFCAAVAAAAATARKISTPRHCLWSAVSVHAPPCAPVREAPGADSIRNTWR